MSWSHFFGATDIEGWPGTVVNKKAGACSSKTACLPCLDIAWCTLAGPPTFSTTRPSTWTCIQVQVQKFKFKGPGCQLSTPPCWPSHNIFYVSAPVEEISAFLTSCNAGCRSKDTGHVCCSIGHLAHQRNLTPCSLQPALSLLMRCDRHPSEQQPPLCESGRVTGRTAETSQVHIRPVHGCSRAAGRPDACTLADRLKNQKGRATNSQPLSLSPAGSPSIKSSRCTT